MKQILITLIVTVILLLLSPFIEKFLQIYGYNIPIVFLIFIPFLIAFFFDLIHTKQMSTYEYKILQGFYFALLFIFLFLGRGTYDHEIVLRPFSMFNDLAVSEGIINKILVLIQIILNIIIFIPLGIWIKDLNTGRIKYTLILFIPIFIESLQYLFYKGVFDTGDIVLNMMGIALGFYLFKYFCHIKID